MEALHLIYQHWFITILLGAFGATPVAAAFGAGLRGAILVIRGK
jgi:hypothetical protein